MSDYLFMPAVTAGAEETKLLCWHVREGEAFAAGKVLAEFESEKAVVELTAEGDGVIDAILVPAGSDGVKAGVAIARLRASDGESVDRQRVSPLARRLARESDIDISTLQGSGPMGRVVERDVRAAIDAKGLATSATPVDQARGFVPLSGMRSAIARRLVQSVRDIPQFPLTIDVDVDQLLAVRARLNANTAAGERLTINDFVVRAVALALRQVPAANSSFSEQGIALHAEVHVSVAVAIDDGLVAPVLRNADSKSLPSIAREMRDLVERAKAKKLKPQEFEGGTFTVSNLGMLGVKAFGSILTPPQACVLSVGAAEPRPVVKAGVLAVATVMTLTLTCDHRVVDGAAGARLLSTIRQLIEGPDQVAASPTASPTASLGHDAEPLADAGGRA